VLPRVERRGALLRLVLQFHHPLIYVLLVAAAVTYLVGEPFLLTRGAMAEGGSPQIAVFSRRFGH